MPSTICSLAAACSSQILYRCGHGSEGNSMGDAFKSTQNAKSKRGAQGGGTGFSDAGQRTGCWWRLHALMCAVLTLKKVRALLKSTLHI